MDLNELVEEVRERFLAPQAAEEGWGLHASALTVTLSRVTSPRESLALLGQILEEGWELPQFEDGFAPGVQGWAGGFAGLIAEAVGQKLLQDKELRAEHRRRGYRI